MSAWREWWAAFLGPYPLTIPLLFAFVNAITKLLFYRPVSWLRILAALIASTLCQFLVLFWVSGWGWGWPDLRDDEALLMRLAAGGAIGFAASLFAWIVTGRLRWSLAVSLVILNAAVFLPEPRDPGDLLLGLSVLVVFMGSTIWYRWAVRESLASSR
jgi:hypothetical protein